MSGVVRGRALRVVDAIHTQVYDPIILRQLGSENGRMLHLIRKTDSPYVCWNLQCEELGQISGVPTLAACSPRP